MEAHFGMEVARMKSWRMIVLLVLAVSLTLVGCFEMRVIDGGKNLPQTRISVSDFDRVPVNSPAFIIKEIFDPGVLDFLEELAGLLLYGPLPIYRSRLTGRSFGNSVNLFRIPALPSFGQGLLSTLATRMPEAIHSRNEILEPNELLDALFGLFESHQAQYQRLRNLKGLIEAIKEAPNRFDLRVTLRSAAREAFFDAMDEIMGNTFDQKMDRDTAFFFDYRDVACLIFLVDFITSLKEHEQNIRDLVNYYDFLYEIEGIEGVFKKAFLSAIELIDTFDPTEPQDWEMAQNQFWPVLLSIAAPENQLRLNDVLNDSLTTMPNIDFMIDMLNMGLKTILEIYEYEKLLTSIHVRSDGIGFLQMLAETMGYEEDLILVKSHLDRSLSEYGIEIPEEAQIFINNQEIDGETTLYEMLQMMSPGFFDTTVFRIVVQAQSFGYGIAQRLDEGIKIHFEVDFHLPDLSGLSESDTNLAIDEGFMDVLIDYEIWKWLSMQMDREKIGEFMEMITELLKHVHFLHLSEDGKILDFLLTMDAHTRILFRIDSGDIPLWERFFTIMSPEAAFLMRQMILLKLFQR